MRDSISQLYTLGSIVDDITKYRVHFDSSSANSNNSHKQKQFISLLLSTARKPAKQVDLTFFPGLHVSVIVCRLYKKSIYRASPILTLHHCAFAPFAASTYYVYSTACTIVVRSILKY